MSKTGAAGRTRRSFHHPQVIVRALDNQFLAGEFREEFPEIEPRERIDHIGSPRKTQLDQADLLEIMMEAVGLGVEGDTVNRTKGRGQTGKGFRAVDIDELRTERGAGVLLHGKHYTTPGKFSAHARPFCLSHSGICE